MIKDFEYFVPKTVEDALRLLSEYKEESKVIAGGQSLLILMRQGLVAPKYLVDIKGLSSLDYIRLDPKEGLRIGSLSTHRAIEKSPLIRERFSVLAEAEQNVGSVQTRNWGTIGGNLSHGDSAGDLAPVLIALEGKVKITSLGGERTLSVENFFRDYFDTVLKKDEILTEIQVPLPPPHTGSAYAKFTKREGDMAIVGTAVSMTFNPKDGICKNARIVLGAVANVPLRAKRAEKMLVGKEIKNASIDKTAQVASEEAQPISDVQASEEYKRELVKVLVKRVAWKAFEKAEKS